MGKSSDDFFEGKRPWSKIKDKVLSDYMVPYLAKVNKLGRPILLIDGYAGPGVFEDGSRGSPILICEKAEERVKGNYQAIFINNRKKYYNKLCNEIQQRGWSSRAQSLLGDAQHLLPELSKTLQSQSVFLYLDPFGPTGCDFALLRSFLDRNPNFSTEVLLTMSMPGIHRLATRHAVAEGRESERMIREYHHKLTRVFGGDYWKEIMWQEGIDPEEREIQLMKDYQQKLTYYLEYTGCCPVREQIDRRIKYFIVFASRHEDAMLLLNDIMLRAYFSGMHEASFGTGLFKDFDWRELETRHIGGLAGILLDMVAKYPGTTRKSLWIRIVKQYFMLYLESEYLATVQRLVDEKGSSLSARQDGLTMNVNYS